MLVLVLVWWGGGGVGWRGKLQILGWWDAVCRDRDRDHQRGRNNRAAATWWGRRCCSNTMDKLEYNGTRNSKYAQRENE